MWPPPRFIDPERHGLAPWRIKVNLRGRRPPRWVSGPARATSTNSTPGAPAHAGQFRHLGRTGTCPHAHPRRKDADGTRRLGTVRYRRVTSGHHRIHREQNQTGVNMPLASPMGPMCLCIFTSITTTATAGGKTGKAGSVANPRRWPSPRIAPYVTKDEVPELAESKPVRMAVVSTPPAQGNGSGAGSPAAATQSWTKVCPASTGTATRSPGTRPTRTTQATPGPQAPPPRARVWHARPTCRRCGCRPCHTSARPKPNGRATLAWVPCTARPHTRGDGGGYHHP